MKSVGGKTGTYVVTKFLRSQRGSRVYSLVQIIFAASPWSWHFLGEGRFSNQTSCYLHAGQTFPYTAFVADILVSPDGWMDGWWLKKILGWRSTWGRVGGRSNFFRSLRPSLSKGSWTCWTWSICPGKSVEHVTSTEGKHTLSKYWGSNSTSPWLSWKWIQFVFIAIINQRIYFFIYQRIYFTA